MVSEDGATWIYVMPGFDTLPTQRLTLGPFMTMGLRWHRPYHPPPRTIIAHPVPSRTGRLIRIGFLGMARWVVVRESWFVAEGDLTGLQLDVYMTREGPWNPDHGEVEIPEGWEFLAAGDAFVTRRVKAAGAFWVAWRPRGRSRHHRRRLGLWAPREAIEAAEAQAVATEEERVKRRVHGARARERSEAVYREELADAIRRYLGFASEHAELEYAIAREAALVDRSDHGHLRPSVPV